MRGEPNNWGGHEECVGIYQQGWNDAQCALAAPFVCFDGEEQHLFHIYSYFVTRESFLIKNF